MACRPSHPGALISNVILRETQPTVNELANRCGVARNTMSKLINESGDVAEGFVIRLNRVLGSAPRFGLSMQSKLDLWNLEQENKRVYKALSRRKSCRVFVYAYESDSPLLAPLESPLNLV